MELFFSWEAFCCLIEICEKKIQKRLHHLMFSENLLRAHWDLCFCFQEFAADSLTFVIIFQTFAEGSLTFVSVFQQRPTCSLIFVIFFSFIKLIDISNYFRNMLLFHWDLCFFSQKYAAGSLTRRVWRYQRGNHNWGFHKHAVNSLWFVFFSETCC